MSFSDVHNGGANVRSARAAGNQTATAGGSGDATQVDGAWVSRKTATGSIALSAKAIISYTATLTAAATLKFAAQFQDAVDAAGAGAANYGDAIASTTAATGGGGGTTETGTAEFDVDLGGAREFIRIRVTPDLSAGATDTAAWSAIYLFFGDQRGFPTKSAVNIASADAI